MIIESISTIDSLLKKSNEKILIDNNRFCSGTLKKVSRVTLKNSTIMHGNKINKNCGFLIHDLCFEIFNYLYVNFDRCQIF